MPSDSSIVHIAPDGRILKCSALNGGCPYGADYPWMPVEPGEPRTHFQSIEDAEMYLATEYEKVERRRDEDAFVQMTILSQETPIESFEEAQALIQVVSSSTTGSQNMHEATISHVKKLYGYSLLEASGLSEDLQEMALKLTFAQDMFGGSLERFKDNLTDWIAFVKSVEE